MTDRRVVTVDLRANNSQYDRAMLQSAALTKTFAREIDHYAGRLKLWAELAASIGPSLVPIGAVGIPAIAGLASELGFAAIAGGTLLASFQGVGGALQALNSYSLSPTDANLKKVHATMGRLGIDAQEFVLRLRDAVPLLKQVRDAAAQENITGPMGRGTEGIFLHLTRSFDDLETLAPKVERIFRRISEVNGAIIETGVENLGQERWAEFFKFIAHEGPSAVEALATTVGNLTHGLAELWMAFEPLNEDVSSILLNASADFDKWAEHLSKTRGFKDFVAYIEEQGPQVAATLGAITDAVLKIVEGFAPIGGEVLHGLELFAKAVASIAGSDIGAPLLAGVAAMATLSRATVIFNSAKESAFGGKARLMLSGYSQELISAAKAQEKVTKAMVAGKATLNDQVVAQRNFAAVQKRVDEERRKALVKGGALAGVLALSATGVAEAMGLQNTAMLAVAGTMVGGPWGLAIGAGIGYLKDWRDATHDASSSVADFDSLLQANSTNLTDYKGALVGASEQLNQLSSAVPTDLMDQLAHAFDPQNLNLNLHALFGDLDNTDLGKSGDQVEKLREHYDNLTLALNQAGQELGGIKWGESTTDIGDLQHILNRLAPAMSALGITVEDLDKATANGTLQPLLDEMHDWLLTADTGVGRAEAVAAAIAAIGDASVTTADKVTNVSDALDALLDPQLALQQAQDAWAVDLRDLNDNLSDHGRRLKGNTVDATENRAVIRDMVGDYKTLIEAMVATGASKKEVALAIKGMRQDFIDAGVDAKLLGSALEDELNQLGLDPKTIKLILQVVGQDKASRDAKAVYDKVPTNLTTELRADSHKGNAVVNAWRAKLLGLRPPPVVDLEADSHKGNAVVNAWRAKLNIPKPDPTSLRAESHQGNTAVNAWKSKIQTVPSSDTVHLMADNFQAMGAIAAEKAALASIHDKSITLTVKHQEVQLGPVHVATGGLITGPGSGTSDSIPANLSNGEFVMRAGAVNRYGVAMFQRLNMAGGGLVGFANGGPVKGPPWTIPGQGGPKYDNASVIDKIFAALFGADFGPGMTRKFKKELDGLLTELGKHNKQVAAYNKKVDAWNKAHPDEKPRKHHQAGMTDDLRSQARDLFKEIRKAAEEQAQKERERVKAVREAARSFDTDLSAGAEGIRTELADLKKSLREAGGVWTQAMERHAGQILVLAAQYDQQTKVLAEQQGVLGTLINGQHDMVDEQGHILEQQDGLVDLLNKQSALAEQVSSNFKHDPFGHGLSGFFKQTQADASSASAFQQVLQQLQAMGLDGPAYEALAASGDLKTAIQLRDSGNIDAFEASYNSSTSAANSVGQYAGDTVYGQQIADQNVAIARQSALITKTEETMTHLSELVARQEAVLRDLATATKDVGPSTRRGAYNGTYEGVKDAASGAGKQAAMSNGGATSTGPWGGTGGVWHR